MQVKEGGSVEVEEVVAVTMGPESAFRALHKAVSLGADRSVPRATDSSVNEGLQCPTGGRQGRQPGLDPPVGPPSRDLRRTLEDLRPRERGT